MGTLWGETKSRSEERPCGKAATQAERCIEKLDRLFKRIYEDTANGKLSDSRFQMLSDVIMSRNRNNCGKRCCGLMKKLQSKKNRQKILIGLSAGVWKYLDLDELTPTILNDMVKGVYVHTPDKSKGYSE